MTEAEIAVEMNHQKRGESMRSYLIYGLKVTALFIVYYFTARFGLSLHPVNTFATLVWLPSGIALAALLLYGFRLWPGIFLSAFFANLVTGAPFIAAIGMGGGNTLEAVAGAYMLRRFGFQNSLPRLRDVMLLAGLGALLSTTISATIGVTSLFIMDKIPASSYLETWLAWWVGDSLSDLIVAPMLLVWLGSPMKMNVTLRHFTELLLAFLTLFLFSSAIFGNLIESDWVFANKYLMFLPLIWICFRFRRRTVTLAVLAASVFAVWDTVSGYGPFAFIPGPPSVRLLQLQIFLATISIGAMVLSSVIAERAYARSELQETLLSLEDKVKARTEELNIVISEIKREVSERRTAQEKLEYNRLLMNLLQEITDAANKTLNVNDVLQVTLDRICEFSGWPVGHVYLLDKNGILQPSKLWHIDDPVKYENFRTLTESMPMESGVGLPGRVLATRNVHWIMDVNKDHNFPRAKSAVAINIKAGFGFPIMVENKCVGILEFFSPEALEPDTELLKIMDSIGTQLGRVFERQQAFESIMEREVRFRTVTETANEAIITADSSGMIFHVNRSAERYFGYETGELLGQPVTVLMPADYVPLHTEGFGRYMQTGVPKVIGQMRELEGKRKDGSRFPIVISLSKWEAGEESYFTAIIRDITERKNAEEAMKQSAKQLEEAQQLAHIGSFQWDIIQNKVYWSNELYRIYGIEPEDFGHSYEDFLKRLHPGDKERVKNSIETAFHNGAAFSLDERIVRPDGSIRTLHTRGEFAKDENGKPVKLVGVCQDITEQKQAQEELRRTYEKLKQAQQELIHAEKLAALGRFSSGIAHEIRNPLANISALAQIVISKGKVGKELKKHLKYILVNTDIANKIIRDLLTFAAPEDIEFKAGRVEKVLDKVCRAVKARCNQKKVKLVKKTDGDFPLVMLNEKKLETAFLNFISNSIDAMPKGGTLTITADFSKRRNKVLISFIGQGIGIPAEAIDKVFEPFYTTKDEGTGLGMAMAYQVVKSHNGELDIYSKVDEGTKVTVTLPVK